ncbi:GspE/PulE family protein [Candidatus Clostridium radicumherbarum]|uniref:GspE/PulE family protein n=1 Tax=Candidatus Clostridium radicumherbarum TaxID=3381662 RepID=A0ABW8TSK9_9CLOT
MEFNIKKRLGDLLVEARMITPKQLEDVLEKQKRTGKRLGKLLVDEGIISENDLLKTLEIQLGVKRVNFDKLEVDKEAVKAISAKLANKHIIIPISIKNNKIQVVMSDPLNIIAIDDVRITSGFNVEVLIASEAEIKEAIGKYYSSQYVMKAADDLSKEQLSSKVETKEEEDAAEEIKNAPVVRLVDSIIENAVRGRASDIHIEPFDKYVRVRYRVDGDLFEVLKTPVDTLGALITRIKILADLNIAEKRLPQDGRIMTSIDGKLVDLRVSILPKVNGEKVVIRILSRDNFLVKKENLGIDPEEMKKLDKFIRTPNGIILVTGPTGSGKSTTLYTMLSELNTENKNIITVEDPVEYLVDGINQVSVNTKIGLTFAAGLRSILRQDPDIIMIGEIRDNETAEIAIRSAITGHLVLSTIHTNDAPSSVLRLIDMGIEPYLISSSVSGVIAQRLVRKLCTNCAQQYEATTYEKNILGINQNMNIKLKRAKGCSLCGNTGYKGRVGIYEIMEITREHREMIIKGCSTDELRDLSIKNGMRTLRDACSGHVFKGITSMDELMRVAYLKE